MGKNKVGYSCTNCGSISSKWLGQCPDCLAWGTINEEVMITSGAKMGQVAQGQVYALHRLVDAVEQVQRTNTPIGELNRVLGGGLVSGSAILIGGDPGIGKSTLLLQLCTSIANSGIGCLYVTGEESTNQIKLRAKRLNILDNRTGLIAASSVEDIITTIDKHKKDLQLVVIDSIQTVSTNLASSSPGTVSQVRASSQLLINYAKQNHITLLIACHVNKEGQIAGPKLLEHMVDTVLYFEGDHNNHFRILRAIKNRFGAVNEIGVFEMTSGGLVEIANPSELFLMERENNISGSAIFAGVEGSRPVLMEIQALVAPTNMAIPKRSVVGWDANRLSMMLAVLSVRFGLNLSTHEVYLTVAGGLKITEPAADLAIAAALISAAMNKPLAKDSVFFGEVGLSGEVRNIPQLEDRVNEAYKLGFTKIYCPLAKNKILTECQLENIRHLKQLKSLLS
jgi:DNA repair protein RadA/Sms